MSDKEFSLDREQNIEHNVDAQGKRWEIHTERGRHLYYTLPSGARADTPIPETLSGMFTKRMYLEDKIKEYVKSSWDHADLVAAKNARKAQAAKEAKKKVDAGSTTN